MEIFFFPRQIEEMSVNLLSINIKIQPSRSISSTLGVINNFNKLSKFTAKLVHWDHLPLHCSICGAFNITNNRKVLQFLHQLVNFFKLPTTFIQFRKVMNHRISQQVRIFNHSTMYLFAFLQTQETNACLQSK